MYFNKLKILFENHKLRLYGLYSDINMLKFFINDNRFEIFLYGAGNAGVVALKFLKDNMNMAPSFIVDANPRQEFINTIPVVSIDQFRIMAASSDKYYCAIMALRCYTDDDIEHSVINTKLSQLKVKKLIDLYPRLASTMKIDWYNYFIKNKQILCKNIYCFNDDISRSVYYEYIRSYLEGHIYEGITCGEEDKYWGMDNTDYIYKTLENECWINMGSYMGDTIFNFINKNLSFERIYAIEGEESTFKELANNLSFLPSEYRKKITLIKSYFGVNNGQKKIDDVFADKKVTLINMDIEGSEYDVISSAQNVIYKNRPVLAICVYHKMDDLLKIPNLIISIVKNYSFYLRKYPSLKGEYFDGIYETNELVLYAVPDERNII